MTIRKIVPMILTMTLFFSCSSKKSAELPGDFSVKEFKTWNIPKQAEFIKSLNKKAQMKFLSIFLPNSAFSVPPVEYVKFFPDGEIIFDWNLDGGGEAGGNPGDKKFNYFMGSWKFDGEKIIVSKKDNRIPVIKDYEEWISIEIVGDTTKDELLTFDIIAGVGDGITLSYFPEGMESTPAIESYSAIKRSGKKE